MTRFDMLMRSAMIASVLAAGSCAAPQNDGHSLMADALANHPIAIEPGMQSIRLAAPAAGEGLAPGDAARLDMFLADYRLHGSGSISIVAPPGQAARAAIGYFAERIAASGVPRDRILVATREAPGDFKVEVNYISYRAATTPCGDWSENLADTASNLTPKNFGCAIQQNVAAMVADPRDLKGPRPLDGADGTRHADVIGKYEQGKPTPVQKAQDQSGSVSDVAK